MKITVDRRDLTVVGAVESKVARIRTSATMMEALAGLYSDPIYAVCREYMTNMLDGHIRLKKLRPNAPELKPLVHLPNKLEPWIEFIDYGIGMDYAEVWDTFTDFGASTKQDSNDEVGGLGLGCKTAFTYGGSEVWSVESRYDGIRHIIHAAKNADGMPSFHRMASIPTDEPNGVTIRLPVRTQDFEQFTTAVLKVLNYFPIACDVTGTAVKVIKPDYLFKGATWGLQGEGHGQPQAIMGNVAYPVSSVYGLNYPNAALDVFIPVGDMDITPSREALKYNDRTKQRLKAEFEVVRQDIQDQAAKSIVACPTLWEANVKLAEFTKITWLRQLLTGTKWQGHVLDPTHGLIIDRKLNPGLPTFANYNVGRRAGPQSAWEYTVSRQQLSQAWLYPNGKHRLFYNDLPNGGAHGRIREAYQLAHGVARIGTGRNYYGKGSDTGVWYLFDHVPGMDVQRLSKLLGGVPVEYVSVLPAPPVKPRTGSGPRRTVSSVQLLTTKSSSWVDAKVDAKDGGYYVRTHRGDPVDAAGKKFSNSWNLARMYTAAVKLELIDKTTPLVGIPRSAEKLTTKLGWIEFIPWLKDNAVAMLKEYRKERADWPKWRELLQRRIVKVLVALPDGMPQDILEFVEEARSYQKLRDTLDGLIEINTQYPTPEAKCTNPDKQYERLLEGYPLLKQLDDGHYYSSTDELIKHIASVERYILAESASRRRVKVAVSA